MKYAIIMPPQVPMPLVIFFFQSCSFTCSYRAFNSVNSLWNQALHRSLWIRNIFKANKSYKRSIYDTEENIDSTTALFGLLTYICHIWTLCLHLTDGDPVPVPHFGLAMSVPEFHTMAERVRAAGVKFIIEPHLRFVGQPGEQVRVNFFTVWRSTVVVQKDQQCRSCHFKQ